MEVLCAGDMGWFFVPNTARRPAPSPAFKKSRIETRHAVLDEVII
jgi:hypothetical protein